MPSIQDGSEAEGHSEAEVDRKIVVSKKEGVFVFAFDPHNKPSKRPFQPMPIPKPDPKSTGQGQSGHDEAEVIE